ncbi:MAG: S-methyl-5-thioribose-1-phosphate isomerase [Candidatus Omnitrophota bacterium]
MKESILFWPVRLKGNTLAILDETRIPKKVSYLKVCDYRGAIRAVVDMKTRAFGQFLTVCYAFMLEVKKAKATDQETLMALMEKIAAAFHVSRPTFPFGEVTAMVLGMAHKVQQSPDFKNDFLRLMDEFLEKGIRVQRYERARKAAELLSDGDTVLTHCHVSGEMSLIGEFCKKSGKRVKFIATETRPYFQGSRLTAWELKTSGFDVTLVPDNAVGKVMADGKVDCVIVGSDRSAANGDFANKIGTYQIALLAKYFRIPFYVLAQPSQKLKTGADIPIEIRADEEILTFEGHRLAKKGLAAYYPGFDVVDHRLVTRHIGIHAH